MSTLPATLPEIAAEQSSGSPAETYPGERRVLVVVRWPVGGIRTHILYNYSLLATHGYRFTFIGPQDATFDTFAQSLANIPGCEFATAPVQGPRCRLAPAVRCLARSGRFAFLHSHGLTAAVHGVLGNIGQGLPHLATVHDPLRPDQFQGLPGRAKCWLLGRLMRRIDTLIPVSEDIHANLLDYLPTLLTSKCRLRTIPNGIDTERYAQPHVEPGQELRQRLGIGPDVYLMGFLGRFMEQKGFLPLLEALERLLARDPAAPFHLVAVGSGDYQREYLKQIELRGLTRHISVLPFVMDVQPLLRQLDLLVTPSLWEASSLVSMEAMAAGIPVLGSDCIGLREVLRDTPSRLVRAGDVDDLCRGLQEAMARPWAAEARAFAPTAWKRFDIRRGARRLLEVFEAIHQRR
jgi:glycosyltransferase involved in cell wall biosynthesis